MARAKTDPKYTMLIGRLMAEGWRPGEIDKEVERIAQEKGWKDYPAPRTILDIRKEIATLDNNALGDLGRFRWPDAMEAGLLPWEASEAALQLVQLRSAMGMIGPTVGQAKWYYRVGLAGGGHVPHHVAMNLAALLAARDWANHTGQPSGGVGMQALMPQVVLATRPWEGDEAAAAFRSMLARASGVAPSLEERGEELEKKFAWSREIGKILDLMAEPWEAKRRAYSIPTDRPPGEVQDRWSYELLGDANYGKPT